MPLLLRLHQLLTQYTWGLWTPPPKKNHHQIVNYEDSFKSVRHCREPYYLLLQSLSLD